MANQVLKILAEREGGEEGEEGGEGRSGGKSTKEWGLSSLLDLKKVFKQIITENLPNLAKLYRQK